MMDTPCTYFVTGIGTEVGKTLISAIIVESLCADYWKPIQAGDLDHSDTDKVKSLITNKKSCFYNNAYSLKTPMSPHAAAEIDAVYIDTKKINRPNTNNDLVIEGAGGLLVPLNENEVIADLIGNEDKVILVSRHYLGSINHSLLSIHYLKSMGFKKIGIIFSGDKHPTTENIILSKTSAHYIGRVEEELHITREVVIKYAELFRNNLLNF